ncbi:GH25 family lysozyme, partial [Vibrio parahaemolyticus]
EPAQNPIAQADALVEALADMSGTGPMLPPVIDFEVGGPGAHLAALTWVRRVETRTGRPCVVYTSAGFWNKI